MPNSFRKNKKRLDKILTGRIPSFNKKTRTLKLNKKNIYSYIVPVFLNMLNTVKLYHWKTTNFATHKATDELYSGLNDKLDEFVEVMLGKNEIGGGNNRSRLLDVNTIKLNTYSGNDSFKREIEIYKSFLLSLSNNAQFNTLSNTDLLAIRDEILALLNKFLYLLTLK